MEKLQGLTEISDKDIILILTKYNKVTYKMAYIVEETFIRGKRTIARLSSAPLDMQKDDVKEVIQKMHSTQTDTVYNILTETEAGKKEEIINGNVFPIKYIAGWRTEEAKIILAEREETKKSFEHLLNVIDVKNVYKENNLDYSSDVYDDQSDSFAKECIDNTLESVFALLHRNNIDISKLK